jgi:hypothetical protein
MDLASELIDALGGTTSVARLTGVKPPSVHEWRGHRIPRDKLVLLVVPIEAKTQYRRWDLFPNDWHRIWPELIGVDGAPEVPETVTQPGALDEVRDAA